MTKRQVSEGQILKEGEAVAELVIEDPLRLWSQVPEQYVDAGARRPARAGLDAGPSRAWPSRARSRGSARRSTRRAGRSRSRPWSPTSAACSGPAASPRPRSSPTRRPRPPSSPSSRSSAFAGVTKLFIVEHGKARADRRHQDRRSRDAAGSRSRASHLPAGRGRRHHRADATGRRDAGRDPRRLGADRESEPAPAEPASGEEASHQSVSRR